MHFKTLFACVYIYKCCMCVNTHPDCKHLKYDKLPSGTHYCGCSLQYSQTSMMIHSSLSHKIFLVRIQKYANKF